MSIGLAATQPASAIVVRDDQEAQAPAFAATNFPATGVVQLNGSFSGSGTLIGPRHVLTAGHISASRNLASDVVTFTVAGQLRTATQISVLSRNIFSGNDLAVYQLNAPVLGVTPATLYTGSRFDLLGTTVGVAGVGQGGAGSTGAIANTNGVARGGTNILDAIGLTLVDKDGNLLTDSDRLLYYDFDSPAVPTDSAPDPDNRLGSSAALPFEALTAPGDSGGGLYAFIGGQYHLAGVHSFVIEDADDIAFDYGEISASTSIEANLAFIQANIPEPTTLALLTLSLPLLLRRRPAQSKR